MQTQLRSWYSWQRLITPTTYARSILVKFFVQDVERGWILKECFNDCKLQLSSCSPIIDTRLEEQPMAGIMSLLNEYKEKS